MKTFMALRDISPKGVESYNANEVGTALAAGTAASSINWPNWVATFEDPSQSKMVGKISYWHHSRRHPCRVSSEIGHWTMGIMSASKNKQEAFDFMVWATSPEQIKISATRGNPPVRTSVFTDPELTIAGEVPPLSGADGGDPGLDPASTSPEVAGDRECLRHRAFQGGRRHDHAGRGAEERPGGGRADLPASSRQATCPAHSTAAAGSSDLARLHGDRVRAELMSPAAAGHARRTHSGMCLKRRRCERPQCRCTSTSAGRPAASGAVGRAAFARPHARADDAHPAGADDLSQSSTCSMRRFTRSARIPMCHGSSSAPTISCGFCPTSNSMSRCWNTAVFTVCGGDGRVPARPRPGAAARQVHPPADLSEDHADDPDDAAADRRRDHLEAHLRAAIRRPQRNHVPARPAAAGMGGRRRPGDVLDHRRRCLAMDAVHLPADAGGPRQPAGRTIRGRRDSTAPRPGGSSGT